MSKARKKRLKSLDKRFFIKLRKGEKMQRGYVGEDGKIKKRKDGKRKKRKGGKE